MSEAEDAGAAALRLLARLRRHERARRVVVGAVAAATVALCFAAWLRHPALAVTAALACGAAAVAAYCAWDLGRGGGALRRVLLREWELAETQRDAALHLRALCLSAGAELNAGRARWSDSTGGALLDAMEANLAAEWDRRTALARLDAAVAIERAARLAVERAAREAEAERPARTSPPRQAVEEPPAEAPARSLVYEGRAPASTLGDDAAILRRVVHEAEEGAAEGRVYESAPAASVLKETARWAPFASAASTITPDVLALFDPVITGASSDARDEDLAPPPLRPRDRR